MVAAHSEPGEMYIRLKELQRQLEILEIQEEYIKHETKNLKREMIRAKVCFRFLSILHSVHRKRSVVCNLFLW